MPFLTFFNTVFLIFFLNTIFFKVKQRRFLFHPLKPTFIARGEDFPSLKAALPSACGNGHRQNGSLNQKQKHVLRDESHNEQRNGSRTSCLSTPVDMRPQLHLFVSSYWWQWNK